MLRRSSIDLPLAGRPGRHARADHPPRGRQPDRGRAARARVSQPATPRPPRRRWPTRWSPARPTRSSWATEEAAEGLPRSAAASSTIAGEKITLQRSARFGAAQPQGSRPRAAAATQVADHEPGRAGHVCSATTRSATGSRTSANSSSASWPADSELFGSLDRRRAPARWKDWLAANPTATMLADFNLVSLGRRWTERPISRAPIEYVRASRAPSGTRPSVPATSSSVTEGTEAQVLPLLKSRKFLDHGRRLRRLERSPASDLSARLPVPGQPRTIPPSASSSSSSTPRQPVPAPSPPPT